MSQVRLGEQDVSSGRSAPLLEVNNLSVRFEKSSGLFNKNVSVTKAVDNVSLQIRESETISVVGESGSGKTTLAKCIMTLVPPTSGSITYNGVNVANVRGRSLRAYLKDVQMVFQDPFESLNPRQDVSTIISIPIRHLAGVVDRSKIADRTSQLLEEVGLIPDEVLYRFPHQLSGGQRQRINIARALASDPKVLIADEPITMLDAAQRLNVLSLLMGLRNKRKLAILMITHDLASARITSDRTLVMYLGKVVETGPTDAVLEQPNHPYVETILSAMPKLVRSNQAVVSDYDSWRESKYPAEGCVFRPRCKYATEVCKNTEPPLKERNSLHFAACHNPLNA